MPHPTTTAQSRCDKVLTKPSESATWHRDDDHTWIALDSCVFSKNCLADATLSDSFMAFFHLRRRRVHQSWWNPLEVWRKQVKIIEPKYGPSSKPIIAEDSREWTWSCSQVVIFIKSWGEPFGFISRSSSSAHSSWDWAVSLLCLSVAGHFLWRAVRETDKWLPGSSIWNLNDTSPWSDMISMGQKLGTWMKIA